MGPVLRRLSQEAPEGIAAVADVDRSLIDEALTWTPETRLARAVSMARFIERTRAAWSGRMYDPKEGILVELLAANVEFIVVGGLAAVLQGAPVVTFDVDIVRRRTEENVDRLLAFLLRGGACHRLDLANRRLPPFPSL